MEPPITPKKRSTFDRVIYHGGCPDGITAAWCFWRERVTDFEEGRLKIDGWGYGRPPPDVTGQRIAIVDFSFPRDVLTKMASIARSIVVLDHHETARRDLEDLDISNVETVFDIGRSGCQIAWDYVYGTKRPWFVDVIGDHDRWDFSSPITRPVTKGMYFKGYITWEMLESLYKTLDRQDEIIKELVATGEILIAYDNTLISGICHKSELAMMTTPKGGSYRVRIVSAPADMRSNVGDWILTNAKMSEGIDFAVIYRYELRTNSWVVSCRASERSTVDLSEICNHFPSGGGHPRAAGFSIQGESFTKYFTPISAPTRDAAK